MVVVEVREIKMVLAVAVVTELPGVTEPAAVLAAYLTLTVIRLVMLH